MATVGPAGYAPVAPGTVGAAVGVALCPALAALGSAGFSLGVVGLLALGIWAADGAERAFDRVDDGRIVIDEVVGQLVALAPLAFGPSGAARAPLLLVTGFVAFRVFDIWKPGPVRWAERRFSGGAGVVLDDVAAGVLGAAVVGASLWIAGGVERGLGE